MTNGLLIIYQNNFFLSIKTEKNDFFIFLNNNFSHTGHVYTSWFI